jgi:hypothetical protein
MFQADSSNHKSLAALRRYSACCSEALMPVVTKALNFGSEMFKDGSNLEELRLK